MTEASLDHALQLIENALEIVGDNEVLYAVKGQVYVQFVHTGLSRDDSCLDKAEQCLEKVFALNPDSAEGHSLRAFICYKRGELREAVRAASRALAIDPHNVEALTWSCVNLHLGRPASARRSIERLVDLEPLH